MNAQKKLVGEVAASVIDDLRLSGIDHGAAVRTTQELIALAQTAVEANGGTGDGNQVVALLTAAARIVLGYASNPGRFTYEELIAAVEGTPVLRLVSAAPK